MCKLHMGVHSLSEICTYEFIADNSVMSEMSSQIAYNIQFIYSGISRMVPSE